LHTFIIVLCFFCVFISASVSFILVFFQAHLVYFRETEVAALNASEVAISSYTMTGWQHGSKHAEV